MVAKKIAQKKKPVKSQVMHSGMPGRDHKLVLKCDLCKNKFHPWHGYTARFCGAECARKGRNMGSLY